MAVPNMIVTLVANTTKYAQGLRKASKDTLTFGDVAKRGFAMAATAMLAVGGALARIIPNLAQMGAESRKADIQLKFMLENMEGISAATDKTILRMAKYATRVSKLTGLDDEAIKSVQKKILVFKSLRDTADELGGTFDRTTQAAIDLAAAGFGDAEANAIKLGRILEDPIANLNALNRAGITFNAEERKKIQALTESGKLLEAQDIILKSIENRVGGLAEKSATPFEKMSQQFAEMGDTIGEAMLPHLEEMNEQISKWLSSEQGKKDLQDIVDAFVSMAKGINAVVTALIAMKKWWNEVTAAAKAAEIAKNNYYKNSPKGGTDLPTPYAPYSAPSMAPTMAPVTVNFNTPVDSVSAGREIQRVLADYQRVGG